MNWRVTWVGYFGVRVERFGDYMAALKRAAYLRSKGHVAVLGGVS